MRVVLTKLEAQILALMRTKNEEDLEQAIRQLGWDPDAADLELIEHTALSVLRRALANEDVTERQLKAAELVLTYLNGMKDLKAPASRSNF